jgi:hypothetical protein
MQWKLFGGLGALVAGVALLAIGTSNGWFGVTRGPGDIKGAERPRDVVDAYAAANTDAAKSVQAPSAKQILFGDFHVHTTFSLDAFNMSLPMVQGEGAHPPADACDFARYCSALDFWSINDHVEGMTPLQWKQTRQSIQACNAQSADQNNPDMVAFLGWEWTQIGLTPKDHYGHKNVIIRDIEDDKTPVRPIAALSNANSLGGAALASGPNFWDRLLLTATSPDGPRQEYHDYMRYLADRRGLKTCPAGVDVRKLPADCMEGAATPPELFEKLNQWGFPAMVIPHGTTWGFYTPAGVTFDKQLAGKNHDPRLQPLFEIYSGHGNSEEYRDYKEVILDADGNPSCPAPTKTHLPSCWQAGEIIRKRCKAEGKPDATCEEWAVEARKNYVAVGVTGYRSVVGARPEDWGDSGQCRDCTLPAFNYRPGNSAQYVLALTNFDEKKPKRFDFGFIGSSDNHYARAGTGYKEFGRMRNTEGGGPGKPGTFLDPEATRAKPESRSVAIDLAKGLQNPFMRVEFERQASFFMTGGLVAVHSENRSRGAIWDALQRKEVYATSGPRILLWFDLDNAQSADGAPGVAPMGATVAMDDAPSFTVRAVGSFKQNPGCPEHSIQRLGKDRLQRLCQMECYNPSSERKRITRIEVIRVRPQNVANEDVASLIQDVWKKHDCPADASGCTFTFKDDDYVAGNRDTTYYVRAIEEPSMAVNGGNLRCERDAEGNCIKIKPCYKDYRTDKTDDCLAEVEERAWSSPIYLNHPKGLMRTAEAQ